MTVYVADAHALIWYLFAPYRLGPNALRVFESIESDDMLIVPTVVTAEIIMVAEKRRISATVEEVTTVLESLNSEPFCEFPPLTTQDILQSASLVQIPDIFDRLIVYEAIKRGAALLTRDKTITDAQLVQTIW